MQVRSLPRSLPVSARRIRGQGLTEYIIILGVIAISAVFAVSFFGTAVKSQFVALGTELVGEDGSGTIDAVATAAADNASKANTPATLSTYTNN